MQAKKMWHTAERGLGGEGVPKAVRHGAERGCGKEAVARTDSFRGEGVPRVRVACGLRRGGIRLRGIVTREVPSERCDKRGVAIGWGVVLDERAYCSAN